MDTKDKDQEIIDRSEAIAIQYLKETYDLDVIITEKKILPKMAMSWVTVSGHVTDHENFIFSVSVDYESNEKESFSFNTELEELLVSEGYDPYIRDRGGNSGK
ncbi:hypothetical protein [Paenibacillus xylanexedens]|uniref:Uncharacterized protein n=1 Tax=Paenibacillus xylanexedens TaxID=528191 RepID=A0ABS4RU29_PAEXY|nr:hypothetical protein [Paenibacillus xylanexedens]